MTLLLTLINCAEKASNIARVCRSNEKLLSLLVQEKSGAEKNQRFDQDFKTLADVLIQETIKHEVGTQFPDMREHILGEESPNFTNTNGQKVSIAVGATESETAACLEEVLGGFEGAAAALATEVHAEVAYKGEELGDIPAQLDQLDYSNLGIWIDPIDATAEYIAGDSIFSSFPGITSAGLDCVTVLIGVYKRDSGVPIIGIVAQPFAKKLQENSYQTALYWGVCLPTLKAHNCFFKEREGSQRIGIFSSSEQANILQSIRDLNYELAFSAGAGHKALKVICQDADVYLLSKGSTFKWDTCAPQAILRALGGDIYDYVESINQQQAVPINYISKEDKCNTNGLIAVRNPNLVKELLEQLA
ncbi:Ipp [Drosophila busckii]|uniref:Ipp n=1 Tax=Drosophila busckii TaxID=30019 RepID=A0A0M4EQF8_DROBS|nr:Ipp [Drosophila busckii]